MKLNQMQKQICLKYKDLFSNTGGNDIVELLERTDATLQSNPDVVLMQVACTAQLRMLETIIRKEFKENSKIPKVLNWEVVC